MLVSDIIAKKGGTVITVAAGAQLAAAAGIMTAAQVGALVVDDAAGGVAGLVSEREVTAAFARWGAGAATRLVRDVMIMPPSVGVEETALAVISRMTVSRTRHAPVVNRGRTVGILSIGDLLKSRLEEKTYEAQVLQDIAKWPRAA